MIHSSPFSLIYTLDVSIFYCQNNVKAFGYWIFGVDSTFLTALPRIALAVPFLLRWSHIHVGKIKLFLYNI